VTDVKDAREPGRVRIRIDREWGERRNALLRAEENELIRAARDRATGDERLFFDALPDLRARNARGERPPMIRKAAATK
jgi:hypothetical protein